MKYAERLNNAPIEWVFDYCGFQGSTNSYMPNNLEVTTPAQGVLTFIYGRAIEYTRGVPVHTLSMIIR